MAQSASAEKEDPSAAPFPGPRLRYTPWQIFDPYLATREALVTASAFQAEPPRGEGAQLGFGLAFGLSITTRRRPFFVRGSVDYGARLIDGRHWILTLGHYSYGAGVTIGPVDLDARLGLSVFDAHLGKGEWGVGMFSPRVGAGISVRTQTLRIGVLAFSEYSWRWTEGDNLRLSGVLLDFAIGGRAKGLPARYELR